MFVYIFEDGTIQTHESGPTLEDQRAIDDGLLQVLWSETAVREITKLPTVEDLPVCELRSFGDSDELCHLPI
jgi:hypothetical protein